MTAAQNGNFATALKEWKPLAEQGLADAQYNLAVMYAFGKGVIHDDVYAHMWWNISASTGDDSAQENKKLVEEKMT